MVLLWWCYPVVPQFWCFILIRITLWIEIYSSASPYVLSRHLNVLTGPVGPLSYGVPFLRVVQQPGRLSAVPWGRRVRLSQVSYASLRLWS